MSSPVEEIIFVGSIHGEQGERATRAVGHRGADGEDFGDRSSELRGIQYLTAGVGAERVVLVYGIDYNALDGPGEQSHIT